MKVNTLLEDDIDELKNKCLCLATWSESSWWLNYRIREVVIQDVPATITRHQFDQLFQLSGIIDWAEWLWRCACVGGGGERTKVISWAEFVQEAKRCSSNDFED